MKRLADLLRGIPCAVTGNAAVEIKGIACHSASVRPGFLFVAIEGLSVSGADFIDEAVNRGAIAVAAKDLRRLRRNWVAGVQTQFPRRFLAQVANRFYDFPARKLALVGITGTNGKTTTAWLLRQMVREGGIEPGFVGTIEHFDGQERRPAERTTPESLELVGMLSRMVERNIPVCIAEVSSHAIALERVFDLDFKVAVFTNLSQDHLDFHRTMENYRQVKMKLFEQLGPAATAVTNLDDKTGRDIPHLTRARVITYGTRSEMDPVPDVIGEVIGLRPDGMDCLIRNQASEWRLRLGFVGRHNLYNLLAAFSAGLGLGWDPDMLIAGAEAFKGVPGRLEVVPNDRGLAVFVDYAHTPVALERALETLREFTKGQVIAVFGCGGDRDRTKRPLMGQVAGRLADFTVVTSDNPRSENPNRIIADITKGIGGAEHVVEPDREAAIRLALARARAGDAVLIAGKGHESYQLIGCEAISFDDRDIARRALTTQSETDA
uniref:UDP-N-acetylmuramoyl-L-alanyl-D-glutamate--2,6-diaminopimelate ligase n=1 Tax=candidate division WOR-3 bacterium TaxID=2052148 RepID=A0A7C4GE38_UNCW3